MDEELLQEILSSQLTDLEFAPDSENLTMNNVESIDPALLAMILQEQQKQQPITRTNPSVVTSSIETTTVDENHDDDLLLEDETILERIIALKEMFPESIQNTVGTVKRTVINTSKFAYNKGRSAAWWITSTMCVLVFPILIQKELLQVAEQISREQRSILLGPQAATGGFSGGGF
ncbi:unnamed protein product [Rotaria sp. Silwood1]|nr:unnamed protein product [Rotaria sp. Silwood1]CAF3553967.1 unnamed protein product [Rotaria sp. Silwood1]CAF3594123.1 unnamed protein product [Rotaria sp. Silwood1]CAF3605892.1 unnamed protein product [Rotaria sp. Silwood1]CAF4697785.1 unnamed protein product [Rotaria sp. Silwood1]